MRTKQIQTPFLNYLMLFYGNIGKQLFYIEFGCWRSVLNLFWNLTLNIVCIYGMFFLDPFRSESGVLEYHRFTPLLQIIIKLDMKLIYPMGYFFETAYLQLYGRELVGLLDGEPFRQIYRSCQSSKHLAATVLIFVNLFSFLSDYDLVKIMIAEPYISPVNAFIIVFCLYEFIHYVSFVFVVLIYFKWGMYRRLKELLNELTAQNSDKEHHTVIELRRLSRLNRRFNRIISVPFLAFIYSNVVDSIGAICMMQVLPFGFSLLLYLVNTSLFMLVVAAFDQQIQWTLRQIIATLQKPAHESKLYQAIFNRSLLEMLNSNTATDVSAVLIANTPENSEFPTLESVQVHLKEMHIYLESFDLKVFELLKVDYAFILQTVLLVINTSVLLIQTSKK